MLTENDLHDYQRYVIEELVKNPKRALWLDMGLGKTAICLHAIHKLITTGQIKSALVVAPKTVVDGWKNESELWSLPLTVSLVIGDAAQRWRALHVPADVYVISRDNLAWLHAQDFQCDMLVVDESTSIKDRSTQRWASLCQKSISVRGKKQYRKQTMLDMFSRVVLLSGTPASESYAGLWAQIYLLDKGERLGKTITKFREDFMIPSYFNSPYPVYNKMRPYAIDEINRRLADICISMKSEDYLTLPERIDIIRYTGMNDKRYKIMERDGVIQVDGQDIIAGGVTRWGKLQQISSGFIYDELGHAHVLNHSKEEAFKELIEGTDENVLVLYRYDYEKEFLQSIGGISLDNPDAIKRWQQGKIRLGLLYPSSGGKGLNLQTGGNIVVWYSLSLSLEDYLQANKRIHRQGVCNTVRVYHLLSKGTIDEHIYSLLQSKQDVLNGLMNYFRKGVYYGRKGFTEETRRKDA